VTSEAKLTRRDFFRIAGVASGAVYLCASQEQSNTLISPERIAPTHTIAPLPSPNVGFNNIQPQMVKVEPGIFMMGSKNWVVDAQPIHQVELSSPYMIGESPITFDEYESYIQASQTPPPIDEGWGRGNRPIIHINWNTAVACCNWLSDQDEYAPCCSGKGKVTQCDFSADGYRLPTEAEWEFAARGGTLSMGNEYTGSNDIAEVAWFEKNSNQQSHLVMEKTANELDIFDMSGNVLEWCWEKYAADYYSISPGINPTGPEQGQENIYFSDWDRVRRGVAYNQDHESSLITYRSFDGQTYDASASSFRVVRRA